MTNPIRSPPSRPATQQGDVPYNTRDAALKGATLAFAKPPVKPKPKLEKLGGNGALMAATIADRTHSPRPTNPASPGGPAAPISRQDTGSSYRSNRSSVHISPYPQPGSTLNLPQPSPNARAMSPSNIAASLAAARHTPASSKQPQDLLSRSGSGNNVPHTSFAAAMKARGYDMGQDHDRKDIAGSRQGSPKPASPAANAAADDAPTPSASSLVRMFEMRNEGGGRKPAPPPLSEPLLQSPVSKPPILSPKPRRTISSSLTLDKDDTQPLGFMEEDEPKKKPVAPKPKPKELKLRRSTDKGEQAPFQLKPVLGSPSPKSRPQTSGSMVSAKAEISSPSSYASAPEYKPEPKEKPNLPPPRRSKKTSASTTQDTITAETATDSPKSSSARKPRPSVSVPRKMSVDSEPFTRPTSTPTSSYQRQSLAMIKPHMTGDSLANAMVGAALASRSRPTTPARGKSPPPLPHRSPYHHHHHHHHHHPFHRSPSPSPAKRPGKLRTTMREDSSSSSSSDDKHKKTKKFFGKKHPNKHHEGSRKRWRDSITERERKRYEGVWAANRGLHLGGHLKSQDEVLNLVVRDIWRRSRLPDVVLEEVWELVDNSRTGRLKRDEFVVGLWLVDQSLKGRKLPTRVGESVWASVRSPGLKVKVK